MHWKLPVGGPSAPASPASWALASGAAAGGRHQHPDERPGAMASQAQAEGGRGHQPGTDGGPRRDRTPPRRGQQPLRPLLAVAVDPRSLHLGLPLPVQHHRRLSLSLGLGLLLNLRLLL